MNYRKFRKNAKALSPVIATIILIAVTVAVSVVVAAWMGALTIGFMGKTEQASITNIVLTNNGASPNLQENATITVQNTGSATVTITSATIDSNSAQLLNPHPVASVAIPKGTSVIFSLGVVTGTSPNFATTAQYTIKLMTAKGNTVTSQASYTGP
jgi:flagellin-like protein